jgi:hypothetical protein
MCATMMASTSDATDHPFNRMLSNISGLVDVDIDGPSTQATNKNAVESGTQNGKSKHNAGINDAQFSDNQRLISTNEIKSWHHLTCCKDVPQNTKWPYGFMAASWAASLGFIIYECGYSACDPGSGSMTCAYAFGGLGALFAARGLYVCSSLK